MIKENPPSGFLAQQKAVARMKATTEYIIAPHSVDGEMQCCGEFNVTSSTHICFRYLAIDEKPHENVQIQPPTTPKQIFPNFPDFEAEFGLHPRRKRANLKMV
jgi:hypothetical protein